MTKHVDYSDLTAVEAVSMSLVAVLAIMNGIVFALQIPGVA